MNMYGSNDFNNGYNNIPYQYPFNPQTNRYGGLNQSYAPNQNATLLPFNPNNQVQPPLFGKRINGLEEVNVNDVSTDGSVSIFPMNDGSCIYTKRWTSDGSVVTMKYVPEKGSGISNSDGKGDLKDAISEALSPIVKRIENIEQMLS